MGPLLPEDLQLILTETQSLWGIMREQRLFVTGGTGFFGRWLVESFCHINRQLSLNAQMTVLSRDPQAFLRAMPHLKNEPSLSLQAGDVRTFAFPAGEFSYVIHAATEASRVLNETDPLRMRDTIVRGTEHVLEFAQHCGAQRLLLTSSGAIYGTQPAELTHIAEDNASDPHISLPHSAYAEGKYKAEQLCISAAETTELDIVIARCFAFVGPHLPLEQHFAIGNFIRDAMAGGPITLQGDGTAYRSYLYTADLTIWLWALLFQGQSGRAYNVGSQKDMSLLDVARVVESVLCPSAGVQCMQTPTPGQPPSRYVPNTQRVQQELHLREITMLPEALRKTAAWLKQGVHSSVVS